MSTWARRLDQPWPSTERLAGRVAGVSSQARAVTRRGRLTDAGAGRATVPTYTREWREVAPNKVRMGQSGLHCAACRRNRHGDYVGVRSVAG